MIADNVFCIFGKPYFAHKIRSNPSLAGLAPPAPRTGSGVVAGALERLFPGERRLLERRHARETAFDTHFPELAHDCRRRSVYPAVVAEGHTQHGMLFMTFEGQHGRVGAQKLGDRNTANAGDVVRSGPKLPRCARPDNHSRDDKTRAGDEIIEPPKNSRGIKV